MSVTFTKLADRIVEDMYAVYSVKDVPELSSNHVALVLRMATEKIAEALSEGEDVALDGFGRFYPDLKLPTRVCSGITGEAYDIGHRVIVKFKPFSKLSNKVKRLVAWLQDTHKEDSYDSAKQ